MPAVNVPPAVIALKLVAAVLFVIPLNAVATCAAVAPPAPAVNVKPPTVMDSLAASALNVIWFDSVMPLVAPSVFISVIFSALPLLLTNTSPPSAPVIPDTLGVKSGVSATPIMVAVVAIAWASPITVCTEVPTTAEATACALRAIGVR